MSQVITGTCKNERNFGGYGDYGLAPSISFSSFFDIL
jgi:hypothetical protein